MELFQPREKIPSWPVLLFIFALFAPGWGIMFWMHGQGWDFGWYQTGLTAFLLLALGFLPGFAAGLAAVAARLPLKPTLAWKFGKPAYLAVAWFMLPCLGALAAAISVLAIKANWDLSLSTLHQDLLLRWPDQGFRLPADPPSPWLLWPFFWLIHPWLMLLPAWLEETGWRGWGYAWLRPRGFWTTVFILGLASWLWRLPLLIWGWSYPEHPWAGPVMGLAFQLGLSLVCTWLREISGGILAPALARATLWGAAALPLAFTADYDPLWTHLQGAPGVALLAIWAAVFAWLGVFPGPAKPKKDLP